MMISDLTAEHMPWLAELHARLGFDYRLPAMNTPLFPIKRIGKDAETERCCIALAAKVTAEVYLWLDPDWGTPQERWEAVKEVHRDVIERARKIGFDQLYVAIPPEIAKSFGPRLEDLGWQLARAWPVYTFELNEIPKKMAPRISPSRTTTCAAP